MLIFNRSILLAILFAAFCGCDTWQPSTATVSGEVKQPSGDPFGVVKVTFHPESGPSVEVLSDIQGNFTAQVPQGRARVTVESVDSVEELPDGMLKRTIRPKYHAIETSGFAVDIVGSRIERLIFVPE